MARAETYGIETLADAEFELSTWSKDPRHNEMARDVRAFPFDEVMAAARDNVRRRRAD
jgi:hypothetical protein